MQTLTVQITHKSALVALQNLEQKHFIKIVKDPDLNSKALPGEPLSISEFKKWVADAENTTTTSLIEAKNKWAIKRKQLQKLIK